MFRKKNIMQIKCNFQSNDLNEKKLFYKCEFLLKVGATSLGSRNTSASGLSMRSIGSIVELHRSLSLGSRSGLTPPPRVISMRDNDGNEVVTEWQSVQNIEVSFIIQQ